MAIVMRENRVKLRKAAKSKAKREDVQKIVNQMVVEGFSKSRMERTLRRSGYDKEQVEKLVASAYQLAESSSSSSKSKSKSTESGDPPKSKKSESTGD